MTHFKAWPRAFSENALIRALLRHQFWRRFLGSLGPRYASRRVGQVTMYLDLLEHLGVSRFIFKNGCHEPAVTKHFPEWIGGRGDVIDVGANIGYFTLLAAQLTTGTVYAFEPEPHSFRLLEQNVAANGFRNVRAFNKAAGVGPGVASLFISEHNAGDHRLFESGDAKETVEVEIVAVDQELPSLDDVALVKIDVQGFEERVVRGMEELLTRNRNVVVLSEFEPGSIQASGAEPDDLLDFMESLGFSWLVVDELTHELVAKERGAIYELCGGDGHVDLCFSRA